jgi:signal peptidase I
VKRRTIIEYALIAIVAIVLALVVQAYVVKPYRIPSASMNDTLLPGDRVLVNRLVYHFRDVHRGDIIVFRYPVDTHWVFIKRVVGLPGDTLQTKGGLLYVNGKQLSEPYIRKVNGVPETTDPGQPAPGTTMAPPWSLSKPYKVPSGNYFAMGDNRTQSDDSRTWGPVPAKDLIGRAFFVYWPLTRIRRL